MATKTMFCEREKVEVLNINQQNDKSTQEVFFICNEHLDVMLAEFLVYETEMQVSGFASGWKV